MGFRTYKTSVAAAVATNGTFTFSLETADVWGQVQYEGNHQLYAEGLQALFNFPHDFSLSASGTTVTVTYLGTTSIPAGSAVRIQLQTPGEDNYLQAGKGDLAINSGYDILGNTRWAEGRSVWLNLGAPAAASATAVVNAGARTGTNTVTTYSPAVTLDVPRNLQYTSSNAGDTTQTVIVAGTDEYGVAMTEKITLNGTSVIAGKKAFKTVISDTVSATLTGNLSIGSNTAFGFPFFVRGGTSAGAGYVVKESVDGATPTAGTVKGGDLTLATNATGDVRGTYVPNTAANGTHVYEVMVAVTDVAFKGVTQA